MINRRSLIAGDAAVTALWLAFERAAASTTYQQHVRSTWAPLQADRGMRELVRYATLAANSHNSQS